MTSRDGGQRVSPLTQVSDLSADARGAPRVCSRRLILVLGGIAGVGNALGYLFYFDVVWSYDKLMHFYTSLVIALALAVVLQKSLIAGLRRQPTLIILVITAFGIALGVAWEIVEWVVDIRGYPMIIKGKSDTMFDLIADGAGAYAGAVITARRAQHQAAPGVSPS
jgi:hypothetical protein